MKKLIFLASFIFSATAFSCGDLPTEVNNSNAFVEVISRSQMDLEFVFVQKNNYLGEVKILGGKDYDKNSLPKSCDSAEVADVSWETSYVATDSVGDQSGFTAAYKVCMYSRRGELVQTFSVCNEEVGD